MIFKDEVVGDDHRRQTQKHHTVDLTPLKTPHRSVTPNLKDALYAPYSPIQAGGQQYERKRTIKKDDDLDYSDRRKAPAKVS